MKKWRIKGAAGLIIVKGGERFHPRLAVSDHPSSPGQREREIEGHPLTALVIKGVGGGKEGGRGQQALETIADGRESWC